MQRYGSVVGLRPDKLDEYRQLHSAVWPAVLAKITACGIRNYSIYLAEPRPGQYLLFSYYEYVGADYDADMAAMAADPVTQDWWAVCKPCQEPLATRAEGEWWMGLPEVFHAD